MLKPSLQSGLYELCLNYETSAVASLPFVGAAPISELLTVDDLASLLRMRRQQVYEQTRHRARVRQALPLPYIRINGNLRFRRADIAVWLDHLAEYERTGLVPNRSAQVM
jgi:hypothetical protein